MELLETDAEAFWRTSSIIGQFVIRIENEQISDTVMKIAMGNLAALENELPKLGLPSAEKQLARLKTAIFGKEDERKPPAAWRPLLIDLIQRVCDDLGGRVFLYLPESSIKFYRQNSPLFGKEVEDKFPQMSEDISEAGKCIALDRSTAAVFHLMRVMELGLQIFGTKLGVTLAQQKNWQNILDELNKVIKSMDHKAAQTKAYAAASSHLYNVKIAWRNEVMHPKQTYTSSETRVIFNATETFIRDLASMI
jgi:hypothetical protein